MGEFCGGHGVAEEVALSFRTVLGLKESELLLRFNALGNHALLQVLAHINYGTNDGRVVRIARDLLDEGFVNLQDVDGKLPEIAEARIAGAEVIHGKVDPHRLEFLKYSNRRFGILHKDTFGELKVEIACFETCFSEGGANPREKSFGAEFSGRNIDGNPPER